MNEQHQEMIDEIMDHFDFERVEKVMKALKWEWSYVNGGEVPELWQIKHFARNILKGALKTGYCATGGFQALFKNEVLELNFIVAEWDTTGMEMSK